MDYHTDVDAMARVLVQYIPCDKKVRSEIYVNLNVQMSLDAIAKIRATHERQLLRRNRPFDASVVWMDERFANDMNDANRKFVSAIFRAKAA